MVSIRQVKAARALLAMSQGDLASASGVSEPTIARLESQDGELGGRADTAARIVAALEAAGVEFMNGGQPGVRLNSTWMLHQAARRAELEQWLKEHGGIAESWAIRYSATGLECLDRNGKIVGTVSVSAPGNGAPAFDPPIGQLQFADRAVPAELRNWLSAIVSRVAERS